MTVAAVNSYDQFTDIINSGKPAVFDFHAVWCGPCKIISPVFEKLSESEDEVEFYKVDVDEQPEIAAEVGIRAMPTFVAFKDGRITKRTVGANPEALKSLVQQSTSKL